MDNLNKGLVRKETWFVIIEDDLYRKGYLDSNLSASQEIKLIM